MNKDWLQQLPVDERAAAKKLSSAAEAMKLSQTFQWNLETQLMEAYSSQKRNEQSLFMKFLAPAAWAIAAVIIMLALSWMLRTWSPVIRPAAIPTETQAISFETGVREGDICKGPLAAAHGFDVFLTNSNKTAFVSIDPEKSVGELRSFAWSADGSQLAVLGNSQGSGNIYLTDANGTSLKPVLTDPLGYLMDFTWSRDGQKFATWSLQDNKIIYLVNADGTDLIEKQMNAQILGKAQFYPDGVSLVFYGASIYDTGLFEWIFNDPNILSRNEPVASSGSYAFSSYGSDLAFMLYDHERGKAELWTEDLTTYEVAILDTFPIPKGSGSSVPETASMSWSTDGRFVVFDLGRGANDRVIYLARTDGTGLQRIVDAGYAPAISPDGKCLAYIHNKQVFLLDLNSVSENSPGHAPFPLADLPAGRAIADYRLDRLQWKP